jgi:hypothetical protein
MNDLSGPIGYRVALFMKTVGGHGNPGRDDKVVARVYRLMSAPWPAVNQ